MKKKIANAVILFFVSIVAFGHGSSNYEHSDFFKRMCWSNNFL